MTPGLAGSFPGGFGAELWTFFSYALHPRQPCCTSVSIWHGCCRLAQRLAAAASAPVRYTAFML